MRTQQGWIVGFVDGEGTFTVSIFKHGKRKLGWQVFPEFVVSQGEKSLNTLNFIQNYFNCGMIIKNKRCDNHHEDMYKYCVGSLKDLKEKIIPFFIKNQLKSAKKKDFVIFNKIAGMIDKKRHLDKKGLQKIALLALQMNRKSRPKFSELLRDYTPDQATF